MKVAVPILSLAEARVLGVLIEKQRTVPDTYPLTLNSLLAGCNQKTSRNPVMELTEAQVQDALDSLRGMAFTNETSGGRAMRYAHNADGVLRIPSQSQALLAVLLLRGPQTAGELRIASDRMHNFADISSVEAFLDELAERPAGALVARLGRLPGARENRWMHLLSGDAPEAAAALAAPASAADPVGEVPALRAQVQRLEGQVAALQATVARLCAELGLPESGG
ncbi:MAG TPA: YceH family protein [Pseudorhodoferax sp.]|nr:YceH family protein [Pseudorhodoferax sp.]